MEPTQPAGKMSFRKDGHVGTLIFDNPARHNAVSLEMWEQAAGILKDFAADEAIRVVVLTGAGGKSFVSGADISELSAMLSRDQFRRFLELIQGTFGNNYFVRMTGQSSGQSKMTQTDLPGYVSVDPTSGPVGTVVAVTSLFGWIPGETVHLRVAGIQLPDVTADGVGSVNATFIATQHAPGNISVVLADDQLGIHPSTPFLITA